MRKKLKLNNKKDHSFLIVSVLLVMSIYFLTIGYSAFSATMSIENIMATVDPVANVKITSISLSTTSNGGVSSSENYNHSNIYGYVTLPSADSTVTYKVDVTVFNAAEMKIDSITGLPSNLEYTISGYNIGDTLCNNNSQCNYGATDDMYITIKYKSGAYDGNNTSFGFNMDFNFDRVEHLAKVGNTYYEALQDAINAVPTNGVETVVHLYKNTSEVLTIASGQNITFNLHGNTISNNGTNNVIKNNGTLRISDGTITSNTSQGAINNNAGGVLIMSGGTIRATGSRQAIYNDGGTCTISGSAVLSATSSERAPVQNLNNGTLTILGGTISSTRFAGVDNTATLTIGTKDGDPNTSSPSIRGKTYGVKSTTNYNYYDGIIKGATEVFNDETLIADTESSYTFVRRQETIDSVVYKTVIIGTPITITFDASTNGGSCSEATRTLNSGEAIGTLPLATQSEYIFDGWFTASSGGTQVTSSTTFNANTTLYAQFHQETVAKIGNTEYTSLQSAVNAVSNNNPTTIVVTKDIELTEKVTISKYRKITLDLDGHTLSNKVEFMPIIENEGVATTIKDGTITTNGTQGAVNNRVNAALLTLDNVTVRATGTRQALYVELGTVTIKGNSHLSNTTAERPAVHIKNNGTVIILSGTIEASSQSAVIVESGTVTVGDKDGNISSSSPTIKGALYGLEAASGTTFNFYDGILKGITDAISGTISDQEGTIISGTDGNYTTAHLE